MHLLDCPLMNLIESIRHLSVAGQNLVVKKKPGFFLIAQNCPPSTYFTNTHQLHAKKTLKGNHNNYSLLSNAFRRFLGDNTLMHKARLLFHYSLNQI